MNCAFWMDIFHALGNFQYLPWKVSVDKALREENLHVLLPRLQMDLLSCATGIDCHLSYRAKQGRIVVQFHLRVHRFLKMVAQIYGSAIATSMPLDRKPVRTKSTQWHYGNNAKDWQRYYQTCTIPWAQRLPLIVRPWKRAQSHHYRYSRAFLADWLQSRSRRMVWQESLMWFWTLAVLLAAWCPLFHPGLVGDHHEAGETWNPTDSWHPSPGSAVPRR